MFEITKDPLNITMSLILNLNLLEEDKEYNINEIKSLKNIDRHWITIQKYFTIFNLIQNYCPKIQINGSKFKIIESEIYNRLNDKEKFIMHLTNKKAFNPDSAIKIPHNINLPKISKSIGFLFKKTDDNRFYITKSGLNIYASLKQSISDLIYNEKDIDNVFSRDEIQESFEKQKILHQSYQPEEIFHRRLREFTNLMLHKRVRTSIRLTTSVSSNPKDDNTNPLPEIILLENIKR